MSRAYVLLGKEALEAGDLRMAMIAFLAVDGPIALEGAEPGTEAYVLLQEGMGRDEARAICDQGIAAAAAQRDARDARDFREDDHTGQTAYYAMHCLRAGARVPRERLEAIPDSDDYVWRDEQNEL